MPKECFLFSSRSVISYLSKISKRRMEIYSENLESKKTTFEGNFKFHSKKYEMFESTIGPWTMPNNNYAWCQIELYFYSRSQRPLTLANRLLKSKPNTNIYLSRDLFSYQENYWLKLLSR